jgi:L-amino acid N-acyltransferase YncA
MVCAIRPLTETDWPQVKQIYQLGIVTGDATYETQTPEIEALKAKFLAEPQLVAEENSKVVGWAFLSAVSSRCVYGGVAETSVYIDPEYHRRGVGRALLSELVPCSASIWPFSSGVATCVNSCTTSFSMRYSLTR